MAGDDTQGKGARTRKVALPCAAAVAALVIVPAAALGVAGDFAPGPSGPLDTGQSPWDVVAEDFNGDGDMDLATSNGGEGSVSVFLGDGNGGFTQAPGSPETGVGASFSLAAGDLDGDDDIDIATPNSASSPNGSVAILLNDGDGDFAPAATSPEAAGGMPREVAIADINGDTDLDIAVGNFFPASVTVLINDGEGDGDFTALPELAAGGAGTNVSAIAAAPLDNDSDVDLVVTREFTHDYLVFTNVDGLGGFTAGAGAVSLGSGSSPNDVVVGNFGSNAFNDLAIVRNGTSHENVAILIGAGDGTFSAAGTSPEAVGDQPSSAATADFNGDSNLDLAVANGGDDNISILLGNGAGDFSAAPTSPEQAGNFPVAAAAADLGGDANIDLATTSLFDEAGDPMNLGDLRVLLNNAASAPPANPPANPGAGATPKKKKCKKGRKLKKGKCVKKKPKKGKK